ncbi:MAG: tRNA 2-thiouridine(34) synthase MnmA [Alphaproteobacteria bacterium]|nr:tRNA 2-thiouridine(34) synthase MnmA [Alphaproteobacteria bacterium]
MDWKSVGLDPQKKNRVVVAMSGGVDSSVAAAMMHDAGFDVVGVTLKLYDAPQGKRVGSCCAGVDIYDAAEVAQSMGFPHYVFDYADRFKEEVIDDFVQSYLRGETPLPCVRCNQSVKFKDLLQASKDLQADALVTGHYIQRMVDERGVAQAHRAIDEQKDQSYFLFSTTKEQLQMLRFPLGGMYKQDIRKKADFYGLSVADKPDSQDICFVGGGRYSDVILKLRPDAGIHGLIKCAETDDVLGEHSGIIHYTVGQRKGLGISDHRFGNEPLYVISLDAQKHCVYVGRRHLLQKNALKLSEVNWLGEDFEGEVHLQVSIRSTQKPVPAKVHIRQNTAIVLLDMGGEAIACGQACVFYDQTRLLGGGWISDVCLFPSDLEKKDWLKGCFSQ